MGKKSRNEARELERLEKARVFHNHTSKDAGSVLSSDIAAMSAAEKFGEVAELPTEEGIIPQVAAVNPYLTEPSESFIEINFRSRSLDHKKIEQIEKVASRGMVRRMHQLNTMKPSQIAASKIIRDRIERGSRQYGFVYKDLGQDVEVVRSEE